MSKFVTRTHKTTRDDFPERPPEPLAGPQCAGCGHHESEHSSGAICLHFKATEFPPVCQCMTFEAPK